MPPNPAFSKPSVIINKAAGSTEDITEAVIDIFIESCGIKPDVAYVAPEDLDKSIGKALKGGADLIVSYGGDGTARAVADAAAKSKIPFVPLPGGTMNMLCKALYGTDDWEEVLKIALAQEKSRWLPAGMINDHPFYVGTIMGGAARFQSVRENLRGSELMEAAKEAIDTLTSVGVDDTIYYQTKDASDRKPANIVVVSCPGMRASDNDSDIFEVAAISTDTAFDVVRLGFTALMTNWRDDPNTEVSYAKDFRVEDKDDLDVLMDGEYRSFKSPIKVELIPKGVKVLAPTSLLQP